MKTIDVRGLSCPEPVMMVQAELAGSEDLEVLANEAHTVKNITRLIEGSGRTVSVQTAGDEYILSIR